MSLAAQAGAYASAPAVFVTLVAVVLLLGIRSWCGTAGVALTRQVLLLLDGAIATLAIMFIALVAIRFVSVG